MNTHYSHLLSAPTLEGACRDLEHILERSRAWSEPQHTAGHWSARQVIGHLVDSAANNHQRFVRAQIPAHLTSGRLEIAGYAQDDWVRVGGYEAREWSDVLEVWRALNTQILYLMRHVEPSSLNVPVIIGGGDPLPLEAIMVDYVGHLRHHLQSLNLKEV
jgi:hypothetical protein